MMNWMATKLRAGKYLIPSQLADDGKRIYLKFPYNKTLLEEVKLMEGRKWHGFKDGVKTNEKWWSVPKTPRNRFQLAWLLGENPYSRYEQKLCDFKPTRNLYEHQIEMAAAILTFRSFIAAYDMGLGKTLAWIEATEQTGVKSIWYVGPKSGCKSVEKELEKWNARFTPLMFTYERFTRIIENWDEERDVAPDMVCFDESSKLKNPGAKRSQAAQALADEIRESGYIIQMSGSTAPKSPVDWWKQAEIACPGFLREGNIHLFRRTLSIVEQRESIAGGVYPHHVTWLDDPKKCRACGKYEEAHDSADHPWAASVNEVERLHRRLKGLVIVRFKKDCLDLPEKQYETIEIKPTVAMVRAAGLIKRNSSRAIEALTRLRELADGFQYTEAEAGERECSLCHGKKEVLRPVPQEDESFKKEMIQCPNCDGLGHVTVYKRSFDEVHSPKDEVVKDELDACEDIGRYVIWGGFTATLDRLMLLCHQQGWATLRIDGRGYLAELPDGKQVDDKIFLSAMDRSDKRFQELLEEYPKICVIGHPQAGGMGLTFTASPVALYYSNSFSGEARIQSEDRVHRIGMDTNRGCIIKDLIMFETDKMVLENLKQKKRLLSMTLGELWKEDS